MATSAKRDYVDDFRQDGGVYPKRNLIPGNTTTHAVVSLTCTFCGYTFTANVASGTDKKVKTKCPNCNFETATGL
jgi:uncharacterized ferredoxin-like protein